MKFLAFLGLGAIRTFVDGWAVLMLWRWFVVPLGAPWISYWHAVGIDLFIGLFFLLAMNKPSSDVSPDEQFGWSMGKIASIFLTVGVGWLVHLGVA